MPVGAAVVGDLLRDSGIFIAFLSVNDHEPRAGLRVAQGGVVAAVRAEINFFNRKTFRAGHLLAVHGQERRGVWLGRDDHGDLFAVGGDCHLSERVRLDLRLAVQEQNIVVIWRMHRADENVFRGVLHNVAEVIDLPSVHERPSAGAVAVVVDVGVMAAVGAENQLRQCACRRAGLAVHDNDIIALRVVIAPE